MTNKEFLEKIKTITFSTGGKGQPQKNWHVHKAHPGFAFNPETGEKHAGILVELRGEEPTPDNNQQTITE